MPYERIEPLTPELSITTTTDIKETYQKTNLVGSITKTITQGKYPTLYAVIGKKISGTKLIFSSKQELLDLKTVVDLMVESIKDF